eukprot:CAMPEP_0173098820 /NCGR_PEP_ID=MMETSP1102-20130122/35036_1 /TAXON_ID=49646 /ORGANISM="Geminigera sp., Strain Caron Lab Isolate" /LENGTH=121 /DNA_ID=CAMNT_0013991545 /DNA_START=37 /DNA_END=399 /DNA_ORIENTATION=+
MSNDGQGGCIIGCLQCLGIVPNSKLPADAVALSQEEEKIWVDSLQGDWSIQAASLEPVMQVHNGNQRPIAFNSAKITGKAMILQGGPNGRVSQQQLKFTKSTSTGQVYIDAWGSQVVTAGW